MYPRSSEEITKFQDRQKARFNSGNRDRNIIIYSWFFFCHPGRRCFGATYLQENGRQTDKNPKTWSKPYEETTTSPGSTSTLTSCRKTLSPNNSANASAKFTTCSFISGRCFWMTVITASTVTGSPREGFTIALLSLGSTLTFSSRCSFCRYPLLVVVVVVVVVMVSTMLWQLTRLMMAVRLFFGKVVRSTKLVLGMRRDVFWAILWLSGAPPHTAMLCAMAKFQLPATKWPIEKSINQSIPQQQQQQTASEALRICVLRGMSQEWAPAKPFLELRT